MWIEGPHIFSLRHEKVASFTFWPILPPGRGEIYKFWALGWGQHTLLILVIQYGRTRLSLCGPFFACARKLKISLVANTLFSCPQENLHAQFKGS